MLVLAIDTALNACSVALARDDEVLASQSEPMDRGQAERIAPMADEVMRAAGVAFAEIDRIAVTTGPGSFTGVRVGLSFARALALALDKPCVGLSTLEILALQSGEAGLRAAVIETQGAVYLALYEDGAPLIAPRAVERDDVNAVLESGVGGRAFALQRGGAPDIVALARRAARLDPATHRPDPLYLRGHGAKLPAGQT
ncbi:MAG: tRNA (adenosine(37)-N6)-threonylcarbamoyltransferase complex dimerization subunit type 1 TsaB [Pseudomonadota bacterium]